MSNAAHESEPIAPLRPEEFGRHEDGTEAPLPIGGTPLEQALLARLDEDKAQDIVLIDLKGKSSMSDAMIVASGRSHRHVGALADRLMRTLKDHGLGKAKVEGLPHCDWVREEQQGVVFVDPPAQQRWSTFGHVCSKLQQ